MDRAKINISDINFDYREERIDSITISVELHNINEPRKNMIPKKVYKKGEETGLANTNSTEPESWYHTEY